MAPSSASTPSRGSTPRSRWTTTETAASSRPCSGTWRPRRTAILSTEGGRPRGVVALAVFFLAGAAIAAVAAASLALPGRELGWIWRLKAEAQAGLVGLRLGAVL